jgi:hypothetical protein
MEVFANKKRPGNPMYVKLVPFALKPLPAPKTTEEFSGEVIAVPLSNVELLELNRGKTGALNFFQDFLRAKTRQWVTRTVASESAKGPENKSAFRRSMSITGRSEPETQIFIGNIDATHTLVEPNIYWNDALPYFSIVRDTGEPGVYVLVKVFNYWSACAYVFVELPTCVAVKCILTVCL